MNKSEFRRFLTLITGDEEFDVPSFAGGFFFGMGTSLIFAKAIKGVLLIGVGGAASLAVLARIGCVTVDWSKFNEYSRELAQNSHALLIIHTYFDEFRERLTQVFPHARFYSCFLGAIVGFGSGLLLF